MYFPLFVGVLCLSLFCNALLFVLSSFAFILKRKRELVAYFIVCFVVLRPKSTVKVMAGRSVHLTTLFPGQA